MPIKSTYNILLVGLGLHAKRIYLHFLRQNNCLPKVIVDLESNRGAILKYLKDNNIKATFLAIPDAERDYSHLSPGTEKALSDIIKSHAINKAIISTEPKGHLSYGRFFMGNGVDILIDKPISAPVGASSNPASAIEIYLDYCELRDLAIKNPTTRCIVQSQRRYHSRYRELKNILKNVVQKYEVPLTTINTYHCDGLWSMPNEYGERENHPYKYGYGKLMHSGYHFVDLFAWFAELNWLIERKRPQELELFHQICDPNDCIFQVDEKNYQQFFNDSKLVDFVESHEADKYENFGEVDSYTQLQLKKDDRVVTTGSIHLLQNGFSRRSWTNLPYDTYKGNGRIRHEYLNIQIGPLLNAQVHSYESHEIHDDQGVSMIDPFEVGGLEHFEVNIFKNKEIIGGDAIEKICGSRDILADDYIGHNEEARKHCLNDFLFSEKNGMISDSDIRVHDFTNWLLSLIHLASCKKRAGHIPYLKTKIEEILIPGI